jgi:hypothetical protein
MTQEKAVKPVEDEVNTSETVTVVDKNATVTAEVEAPASKKRVAAAAKVVAQKPKAAKIAVAEKPAKEAASEKTAPPPKAPAKAIKEAAPKAKSKVVEAPKAIKAAKVKKQAPKKPKLVRDSFTLPEGDYALFATLKQRALAAGIEVKKSELLRASLTLLANLEESVFAKTIGLVERIKTGRPKK